MMKQSSIEWLAEKTFSPFITEEKYNELLRQAKVMHKQEMIESFHAGQSCKDINPSTGVAEEYYVQVFYGKK